MGSGQLGRQGRRAALGDFVPQAGGQQQGQWQGDLLHSCPALAMQDKSKRQQQLQAQKGPRPTEMPSAALNHRSY